MDTQTHETETQDAPLPRTKCGVMPARFHAKYTSQGGGCADVLDQTMRELFTDPKAGTDVAGLKATAEHNGVWNPTWEGLNPGMIRMNTANRLRGLLRRGKQITLVPTGGEAVTGTFGVAPVTLEREQERAKAKAERRAAKAEAKSAPKAEAKPAAPKAEAKPAAPKAKRGRK